MHCIYDAVDWYRFLGTCPFADSSAGTVPTLTSAKVTPCAICRTTLDVIYWHSSSHINAGWAHWCQQVVNLLDNILRTVLPTRWKSSSGRVVGVWWSITFHPHSRDTEYSSHKLSALFYCSGTSMIVILSGSSELQRHNFSHELTPQVGLSAKCLITVSK